MQCVSERCVPVVRFAASIDNSGGATITGGVPYATFLNRAPEAFRNWTGPRVTCPTTSLPTAWTVAFTDAFTSPTGTTAISGSDQLNAVIWLSGQNWRHSAATLGLTTVSYYTESQEIFDADMELNDNVTWATDGRSTAYDMESVVLHEAGHFLGLDHTPTASGAVMYPDVTPGNLKRALAGPDIDDVCSVYSGRSGTLGTPCTVTSGTCAGGLVCEGSPGATSRSCVQDCAKTGDSCPNGYDCRASTAGFACLPQIGVPDQCHFCTRGQDCLSGVCLLSVETQVSYCTRSCSEASQCDPAYTCTPTPSGTFCLPKVTCTNQCAAPAECAVDYECTNGACGPRGNDGDRCEISGFCKTCNTCVNSGEVAFCRPCCGKASSGDTQCQSCSATSCAGSLTCTPLSSGDSACIATTAEPALCESCPAGHCAAGLTCHSGRCYAECNPSSPGSCRTCLSLPAGGAVCACPDQVGNLGEPCGVVGGVVTGCAFGLACAGEPNKLCRAQCNLNQPSSCQEGEACQLVSNAAVCMPGSAGSACAPCNGIGACDTGLSCYNGRCYTQCNTSLANACRACVVTQTGGQGICACPDQIANVGEACGNQPVVMSCQPGSTCLEGLCQAECDPSSPSPCPPSMECQAVSGGHLCVIPSSSGGGGGGTGGGGGGGRRGGGAGGSGGGSVTSQGCGCSTFEPTTALAAMVGVLLAYRRRRAR